jgi:sulfatase maturation enzyme AslB (radical SAM superfamily)
MDIIVENEHVSYKPCNVYRDSFKTPCFDDVQEPLSKGMWAPGCDFCKNQEASGGTSRRIGLNQLYKNKNIKDGIQGLSLRYGTLCNSVCIICDETRSSAWATKAIQNGRLVDKRFMFKKAAMPELTTILNGIDTSVITHLDFHGGEPLLNTYPWQMLELCNVSNLTVKINTNGTVWPDSMEMFKKCKSTEIIFSIDDIGKRLEYLRPPAKFDSVVQNINKSKQMGFKTSCTYTLSSLNVYYLPEFLLWGLKTFGVALYGQDMFDGSKFNLYNLSDYAKNKVLEKFNTYPQLKKLTSIAVIEMMKPKAKQDNALNDIINDDEFKNTFPEWWKILTHE